MERKATVVSTSFVKHLSLLEILDDGLEWDRRVSPIKKEDTASYTGFISPQKILAKCCIAMFILISYMIPD